MRGNWKRNAVLLTMAVLVCAAAALNWKYSAQEGVDAAEEAGTKILGEAALVSGGEGAEGAMDETRPRPPRRRRASRFLPPTP